ncbi:ATP-binding protein [Novosphingobium sp. 9]|uniref:ATP-binding protein n=1 Tax=Novosphingobium sp. 9 TaxID=2025349 RepID=UPI0021B56C72|nr:ATP-binding protein [Novosphingobium sp. 9]
MALHGGGAVEIQRTTVKRMAAFVNHFPMLVLGLLVLDVLVIFALAAQTTVPVERLVRAVRADDAQGLLVRGADELRELGRAFHEMRARLHRLLEERTRMIAAVAHDYRTYLTRLELRSDFIEDEYQREATRADLAEMRLLLDDTLTFAQQGAGEGGAVPDDGAARVDLVRELETVVRLRRESGEAVTLARLPRRAQARATPVALHRMLANVLDNAMRYGGGQAHVALMQAAGEDGQEGWAVMVDDRGPGVPEAQLGSLTEPYLRLETSRARSTGGVGLGLSIVEALAHRFGGILTLVNRPEGGLRATLWLRRAG